MKLDEFTRSYIEAGLWCDLYRYSDDNALGEELEREDAHELFSEDDLTREALRQCLEDCKAFQEDNAEDLEEYDDDEKAGHDFWLTRNRHGAGFWDRGLGKLGTKLTKAAQAYGGVMFLLREDGKVEVMDS